MMGVFASFTKKFRSSDSCDADVDDKLADLINLTFMDGMSEENFSDITKKIKRPANCPSLKET